MYIGTILSPDLGGEKHSFAPTYNLKWPNRYLDAHRTLDYVIPQNAKSVFERVVAACMRTRGKSSLKIVDIGCSYGINAALLKCSTTLDELYTETASPHGVLRKRNIDSHRGFFKARTRRHDLSFVGLDPASRAVDYALQVGLIDAAVNADLEAHDLVDSDRALLSDADLIISTGCVGYVTERTFARLYPAIAESRPWVACFVMHPFVYHGIARMLDDHGLATTEIHAWRQRQRRFSTSREKRKVLASMKALDIDDRFERSTGYIYASFHLSVPRCEISSANLTEILPSHR